MKALLETVCDERQGDLEDEREKPPFFVVRAEHA